MALGFFPGAGYVSVRSKGYKRGYHKFVRPKSVRAMVFERDEHMCTRCGTTKNLTLDHVWPRAVGGPSLPDNLQVLCESCNQWRGQELHAFIHAYDYEVLAGGGVETEEQMDRFDAFIEQHVKEGTFSCWLKL